MMRTAQELNSLALRTRKLWNEDTYSPIDIFAIVNGWKNKKITVDKKASTVKENAPPTAAYTPADEIEDDVPSVNDNQNQVVYRTRTGKKYHRAGCSYLKSIIETTVSEAQSMGLGPCSRCNPPR